MTARKSPLKVYRTAIGFHDAYVAAPSQKAALRAWGTEKDLFARGVAELVTDEALTAPALASPGSVIRLSRGGLSEQLAADRAMPKPSARSKPQARLQPEPAKPARKPKPRPSRDRLDRAEAALTAFEAEARVVIADLRRREEALRAEREALERKQKAAAELLDKKRSRERERYDEALERWRAD